jgi:tripartite-type tricarboxylate transporter receptor subunit TctC
VPSAPGGGGNSAAPVAIMPAPKNTPGEIVEILNKEINAALADPKIKTRLADLGGTPFPSSPADFGKLIAEETEMLRPLSAAYTRVLISLALKISSLRCGPATA